MHNNKHNTTKNLYIYIYITINNFLIHFFYGRTSFVLSKLGLLLSTVTSLLWLSSLVEPGHDRADEFLQLLLSALELLGLCQLVPVQPVHGFIQRCCDSVNFLTR